MKLNDNMMKILLRIPNVMIRIPNVPSLKGRL